MKKCAEKNAVILNKNGTFNNSQNFKNIDRTYNDFLGEPGKFTCTHNILFLEFHKYLY